MADVTLQVGVKVLLKNKEGKYLLLLRSEEKYSEISRSESCDIVGGRIDPGTPLLDNLEREVMEETQLKMTTKPRLLAAQDILKGEERHVVRLTYVAETEGEPILDEEHSDYKWFDLDEMKNFQGLDPFTREVIENNLL